MTTGDPKRTAMERGVVCRACDAPRGRHCITLSSVPVHCNIRCSTREAALAVPRADMHLGFCRRCGHLHNHSFQAHLVRYDAPYENPLHHSGLFRRFSTELARYLVDTYDLHGKVVAEIGCGDGSFLEELCALGGNEGIGFEPSHAGRTVGGGGKSNIRIINSYFTDQHHAIEADFICCRQVLEHLESPRRVLAAVRKAAAARPSCPVFFEVPDARYTLADLGVWDLLYEHCSYFTKESLTHLFESSGFEVLDVRRMFAGQYLGIEARVSGRPRPERSALIDSGATDLSTLVDSFVEHYRQKKEHWIGMLHRLRTRGKRVVLWGSGSKGTMFLNTVDKAGTVSHAVDINPRKWGTYVAGTGRPIVSPGLIGRYKPDYIVLTNPNYLEEIKAEVAAMGVSPRFVTA